MQGKEHTFYVGNKYNESCLSKSDTKDVICVQMVLTNLSIKLFICAR